MSNDETCNIETRDIETRVDDMHCLETRHDEITSKATLGNEVIYRWQKKESVRHIAQQLGISRWKVAGLLREHTQRRDVAVIGENTPVPLSLGQAPKKRKSKLDRFETQIEQLLQRYPGITGKRIFEELQRSGYDGKYSILRERLKQLRVRPAKPLTVRFETAPGEQAQMDWATYEINFTQEGKRRVNLFSYVLGYSRRQYICFTERQDFDSTVRQHIRAFEHLGGVAATCLYDNMKVVVTRWEDDQPIYNTKFLAFATHYGYKPWACQIRRPQTKGKVERPFHYIETNLLNGRDFRSLEHLNEVARWWLAQVADVRLHGTTKKTPLELHDEEQPHLLPLPALQFDTAQVVYRVVDTDGTILYANNRYSVPWRLVGELLPARITEEAIIVYNRSLTEVATHHLFHGVSGQQRMDPAHAPPRDHEAQMERLRERFAELGETGIRYLEGLESKQRYTKHHARKILALLLAYPKSDVMAAMDRAIQYHAYGFAALERILAHQGTPKPSWQQLSESEQETLKELAESEPIGPRHSQEYQDFLYGSPLSNEESSNADPSNQERPKEEHRETPDPTNSTNQTNSDNTPSDGPIAPRVDPETPGNAQDPPDSRSS
jgi:transposase